jgi:hypothetical protein
MLTVVLMGNRESVFDSGEGASRTATKSKEASICVNYPMNEVRGSEIRTHPRPGNWNEYNLKPFPRIYWRANLVLAAEVIPAPIAYIKVVVVIKSS